MLISRRRFWTSTDSSRASNRSLRRMDSTKRRSRGAPNSLATSPMSGAHGSVPRIGACAPLLFRFKTVRPIFGEAGDGARDLDQSEDQGAGLRVEDAVVAL